MISLHLYKDGPYWAINDPGSQYHEEVFIDEISQIIDHMAAKIADAEQGVELRISDDPFPEHKYMLERVRSEDGGFIYHSLDFDMAGWFPLDPYYDTSGPENLYVQVIKPNARPSNSILVIHPYKHEGMWVFDDENVGLIKEPFVSGADDLIDLMVSQQGLTAPQDGFNLVFSAIPFPGHQYGFLRQGPEAGGWWYLHEESEVEGWLCPALFKYFEEAPEELFIQVK